MKYKAGTLFNFSRANRLGWMWVVDDYDHSRIIGCWLSGRVFNKYVSILIPVRRRLKTFPEADNG